MFKVNRVRLNKDGLSVNCTTDKALHLEDIFKCTLNCKDVAIDFRVTEIETLGNNLVSVLAKETGYVGYVGKHDGLDIRNILDASVSILDRGNM